MIECSRCGGNSYIGCGCSLLEIERDELESDISNKVHIIRDLEESAKASYVKQIIEIGDHLNEAKLIVGWGNWSKFVMKNIGFGMRSCQEYMKLSNYDINENYYNLGLRKLIRCINEGVNLS